VLCLCTSTTPSTDLRMPSSAYLQACHATSFCFNWACCEVSSWSHQWDLKLNGCNRGDTSGIKLADVPQAQTCCFMVQANTSFLVGCNPLEHGVTTHCAS
jgi:hypothetical protein